MALVRIRSRIRNGTEATSPPNIVAIVGSDITKHITNPSALALTDYIRSTSATSHSRWFRLEAANLLVNEVVDNIRIWRSPGMTPSLPAALVPFQNDHGRYRTNCTTVHADYTGSFLYGDSNVFMNEDMAVARPDGPNVGVNGSLDGRITRTSQPSSGVTNGGVSDWISVRVTTTGSGLTQYLDDGGTLPNNRIFFYSNFHISWDEYIEQ